MGKTVWSHSRGTLLCLTYCNRFRSMVAYLPAYLHPGRPWTQNMTPPRLPKRLGRDLCRTLRRIASRRLTGTLPARHFLISIAISSGDLFSSVIVRATTSYFLHLRTWMKSREPPELGLMCACETVCYALIWQQERTSVCLTCPALALRLGLWRWSNSISGG